MKDLQVILAQAMCTPVERMRSPGMRKFTGVSHIKAKVKCGACCVSKSPINMAVRVTTLDTKETAQARTGEKGASEREEEHGTEGDVKRQKAWG